MGGTIGMMLAARHPHAISKLMVVDMPPFMGAMFGPPGTTAESAAMRPGAIEDSLKSDPDVYYKAAYAPLKGVVLTRIPASAHFIMWDQPERFQSEVKAFLG